VLTGTLTTVEAFGILLGIVSVGFNLFQLYKERVLLDHLSSERKLSESTLMSLFRSLNDAQRTVTHLASKGSDVPVIASGIVGRLEAECTHIEQLLKTYYTADAHTSLAIVASEPDNGEPATELIRGVDEMTSAMLAATENAQQYVFVIGGRSRNDTYLKALANRVRRGDVRYVRVLTGDHIRHPLCVHMQEAWDCMDIGYLPEDKYGGILATHDTVIVALQSSRVPALDKGLRIRDTAIASDYRAYVLELLGTANRTIDMNFVRQNLCKTCRPTGDAQPLSIATA
jgi:hypothetical protein